MWPVSNPVSLTLCPTAPKGNHSKTSYSDENRLTQFASDGRQRAELHSNLCRGDWVL